MYVPMLNLSIGYFFILFIQTITCASPCIYDVGNGQQLDVRTLGNANGKTPKYDNIPTTSSIPHSLSWNGCFSYKKSDGGDCTNAAACFTDTKTGISNVIARQSDAVFEKHVDENLLAYQSPDFLLLVHLTCRDAHEDTITSRQDGPTIYDIFLTSRCACPGKCHYSDGSMSGGAVFIIILLVLLFVYIVGGMLFLKYSRGATGADIIPNRVMWLNVMSYAIDGTRYSIQIIRQKSFNVNYEKL
ncbi:unnamed protein product [Adineta steineri]|uniref:Cation-dependent mannose-6-phosphate receptor n=1 Tax=Adineta steineri TaxID=433720 RepID=A0A815EHS4_9BILA|nr:unnamed protein product [Adineta steineri]CAF1544154.1 unnamed protein product [Adineta steineri]